jgi:hypothetical protein
MRTCIEPMPRKPFRSETEQWLRNNKAKAKRIERRNRRNQKHEEKNIIGNRSHKGR